MAERYTTAHDVALDGDVDLEATVADVHPSFTTKGMFFSRYVAAMGADWEGLAPKLAEPARHGKYLAFENYPLRDYVRVFDHIARARFPGSTREAYRLLARGEVEVFAESTLGKVTFSLLKEPGSTLLRYPDVFRMVANGPELKAERKEERRVIVRSLRYVGLIEHGIGLVEGLVQAFDAEPRIDVTVDEQRRVVYDVSW